MNDTTNTHIRNFFRRDFLKLLAAGATGAGAAGLTGCSAQFQGAQSLRRGGIIEGNSTVSFVADTDHRDATYNSLKPLESEIVKAIGNKQVVIKPNVGQVAPDKWLNATDAGQLRGILDFLKPVYDRKVIIAEGTAAAPLKTGPNSTFNGYKNYGYLELEREYDVDFVELNDYPTIKRFIPAPNRHPQGINLINMYLDPDVYLISATRFKNSGGVVCTLSLKNIVMGAPINHYKQKLAANRNEKHLMHTWGRRGQHYNIFRLATMGIQPDLAVLDGVVGMEGNGPVNGTPVEQGVALASTDWLAADRLGIELMGYDYNIMRYLSWCGEAGMGQDDLSKIKIVGPDYKPHIISYKHPDNFQEQVEWIYEDEEALNS
ncbi:DUF362 domain-containing protein [Candidatus Latescibacterota bacterium]